MSYTVYVLALNDMRMPKVEMLYAICWAHTKEALKELLAREKVEAYQDKQWGKNYRRGGVLEWCNVPYDFDEKRHFQKHVIDRKPSSPEQLDGLPHVSALSEQSEDLLERDIADGFDASNKPLKVGDKIRFRGRVYTIKEFISREGSPQELVFEEEIHTTEIPTELTVAKVEA